MSARPPGMTRAEAAALLGVPADADRASVQRAYLRRVRLVHPDALPAADEPRRRAASAEFDALSRARAVLAQPSEPRPAAPPRPDPIRRGPQPISAGVGNGLLLLVLLAFLLVALVTLDAAIRTHGFEDGAPAAGATAVHVA